MHNDEWDSDVDALVDNDVDLVADLVESTDDDAVVRELYADRGAGKTLRKALRGSKVSRNRFEDEYEPDVLD